MSISPNSQETQPSTPKHVIWVDDHSRLLSDKATHDFFVHLGLAEKITFFNSGDDAFAHLNDQLDGDSFPALIISDIQRQLDDLDGPKLTEAIRNHPDEKISKIPIIIFTAHASASNYEFFAEHGVSVITKEGRWQQNIERMLEIYKQGTQ